MENITVKLINVLEISQRYPTLCKLNLHEVISLYITTNMSSRTLSMTFKHEIQIII